MTLLYDSFGVRRVELVANLWPDIDTFLAGDFSRLFGVINDDEMFTSSEIRPKMGVRYEGEFWDFDLTSSSVLIRCNGFADPGDMRARFRSLLEGTRQHFRERQPLVFYTSEIRVAGYVPEDSGRNVGRIVQRKLLPRVKPDAYGELAGVEGAGLRLIGTHDEYHWHANIEPPHGGYDRLGLYAELMFWRSAEPPHPDTDVETIVRQIDIGYEFVKELQTFASKHFK